MTNQTNFPIPADLEGFWSWDRLHCPRPIAPLEHELFLAGGTSIGFSKAIGELGSAIEAVCKSINYYNYLGGVLRDIGTETMEARGARYKKNVAEFLPRIGDKWEKEWLPEMLPKLEKARNTDYASLSDADLIATFDQMTADVIDRWTVHGYILYSFFAAGQFADLYNEVMQSGDEKAGYEALQGFPTMALESSRGLWRLSRLVRANPELRQAFDSTKAAELPAKLNASAAGREFMKELTNYLEDFGWRADSVYELRQPSWREDTSIPLSAIQGYVSIGDESGPEGPFKEAVARREHLLADARAKLANDPAKLKQFNDSYEATSSFTPIVEDHNHWIDQMGDIVMRYPALELGRRLVSKGKLARPDDVFYLYTAEIKDGMAGNDQKATVAQRRAEMERWGQIVPPPIIGTPPPPSGDPVEDVLMRFFGTPVEPSTDPSVINGIAASPGTVRGIAKVVRSLDEASKLQKGDIMVCEMTLPPWTPLFSTVAGVVADTGGILSHCAIVAREYRIPCVVGTMMGTNLIKDGQTITVDGSRGLVRIES